MIGQLLSCMRVNFTFYRRNKLFAGLSSLMVFIMALSFIPSMVLYTTSDRFEMVTRIIESMDMFIYLFTAMAVMVGVSHHLRNRSVKMVITKPCRIEVWLLSQWAAGLVMAAVAYLLLLTVAAILFWSWKIPFQSGLILIILYKLAQSIILFSYLLLLSVLFHPVVAVVAALLLQEDTFHTLISWATAGLADGGGSGAPILSLAKYGAYGLYLILPSYAPFSDRLGEIFSTFRQETGNVGTVLLATGYAAAVAGLCFLISNYALKKKRLI